MRIINNNFNNLGTFGCLFFYNELLIIPIYNIQLGVNHPLNTEDKVLNLDYSYFIFKNVYKSTRDVYINNQIDKYFIQKHFINVDNREKIFKSKIKVFVQEGNNGRGIWKTVSNEKTWWPSTWTEDKVWQKISEAFRNKINIQGQRWQGITDDGLKIEMYLDNSGNISTAYIIP